MQDDQIRQNKQQPSLSDFKRLEAERDHLRHLLQAGQRKASQGEIALADAESREENNQDELWRQSEELKEASDLIDRQETSLTGQTASIKRLRGERDASTTRADQLQLDVNERTLELREKEQLLAWVLDSSVDGVLVYRSVPNADGTVVDFECVLNNPAAERLYGLECLTGKRLLNLHADIREAGLWDEYLRVMATGEPFEGEYYYAKDDEARWFRVLAIRVANGLAITFSDISHRKQMEADIRDQLEALKRADQMKNEFLSVISHELRTPINGIMGFISILEDGLAGPMSPTQQDYLRKATDNSERLLSLVANLLDMSRLQAGKFSVDLRSTAFTPIVKDVLAGLTDTARGRTVIDQVPTTLPAVRADVLRVAQLLNILLDNALKFSEPSDAVTVRACVADGFVRCEVEDAGIGIGREDLDRLFALFTQVDMSATRLKGGTGLGLVLAKGLVEAQGGTIGVESRAGEGSTFWFTLPIASEA
jgi:signal transduction histidine kinase